MAIKKRQPRRRSVRWPTQSNSLSHRELGRQARGSYFTQPRFEQLEERTLLSVDLSVNLVDFNNAKNNFGNQAAVASDMMPATAIAQVPTPTKVVVVIEENHSYSEIIGSSDAPYINSLASSGALFTNSHGVTHPSQPNYIDLFSGSNQGIGFDFAPSTALTGANLASQLVGASLTFSDYSESMPSDGYSTFNAGHPSDVYPSSSQPDYAQKHNPSAIFSNLGAGTPATNAQFNKIFDASHFPTASGTDYSFLPTVSWVVPNELHDMQGESGTPQTDAQLIQNGDTWLNNNLSSYVSWAQTHNSLLIVTWDEDDSSSGNQIPTLFLGPMVTPGQYSENINHYNVLRTIEDMYGLSPLNNAASASTITDVWAPSVQFTAASRNFGEAFGTFTIMAQLSGVSSQNVSIPFTLSGTATGGGVDYSMTTTSPLVIPAGSTTGTITSTIVDDSIYDPNETIIVTMGTPTHATLGGITVQTITIVDNESQPSVQFTADSQNVGEAAGTFTITAQLSGVSGQSVSIPFTLSGTATGGGVDYSMTTTSPLVIPAGSTSGTITGTIVDDNIYDPNETIIVTMGTPTNATLVGSTVHTITIVDNESQPSVQFTADSQSVGEAAGTFTMTVRLSGVSSQDVSIPLGFSGTATGGGVDYSGTIAVFIMGAGSTTGTITGTIIDDNIYDPNETIIVTMGTPTNATLVGTTVHTITIVDNESQPSVQFTAASQNVGEAAGTFTMTVQLSGVSSQNVSIPLDFSGTATGGGVDYSGTIAVFIMSAGSTTGTIGGTLIDDNIYDPNETIIVTMGTPTNATLVGTTVHTITIVDNESQPSVQFTAASQNVGEAAGTFTMTVQLSGVSSQNVSIPLDFSGTATGGGVDYSGTIAVFIMSAGSTTGTIGGTLIDDNIYDPNETIIVTMGTPTNATLGGTTVHTITIVDNESQPSVQFTAASQNVGEAAGTFTMTAQLSGVSSQSVSIPFTLSGTATGGGVDYSMTTTSPLVITAGSTSGTITGTLIDDNIYDPNETIIVTMGTPTNATLGGSTVHTLTIVDNESQPSVQFTAASQNVGEAAGTFTMTAQLSGVSSQDVSIPLDFSGSTATGGGVDYSMSTTSPLVIPAGSTSGTITGTLIDDNIYDPNETIVVKMGTPTNATLGGATVHTITIVDNESQPSVKFSKAGQDVGEADGTFTMTVQLSGVSGQNVSIPFTLSGTATGGGVDYSMTTTSPLVITAGSTSGTITGTLIDDNVYDPNETIIVTMGTPTNATLVGTTVHTITIVDNDVSVQFTAASQNVGEAAGTFTITAQLSDSSSQDVSIPLDFSGSTATGGGVDYSMTTTSPLVIPAGSTSGTITGTLIDDNIYDPNETIVVKMGTPTHAVLVGTTVHTITIVDNESQPSVKFSKAGQDVGEADGTFTMTAELSGVSSQDVSIPFTLSGTATGGGVDYSMTTTSPLIITAGKTSGTITGTLIDDNVYDPNETIIVTMGTPTNATLGSTTVHTITIVDNDVSVQFTAASQNVGEAAGTFTITAQLSDSSSQDVSIPLDFSGSTATGGGVDYSMTTTSPLVIPAGSTSGTITGTIIDDNIYDPNETIVVKMGTPTHAVLVGTTVHTITIVDNDVAPADHFVVSTQPPANVFTNNSAGSNFTVQITAQTPSNVTDTSFTGSVTIALLSNPTGATLSGTVTLNAASGVVTFSTLSINKHGAGYTLRATATGVTLVDTNAFNAHQRGDGNGDGTVDVTDYNLVKSHFGQSVTPYTLGDNTGDGVVDVSDYNSVKSNFGISSVQAAALVAPSTSSSSSATVVGPQSQSGANVAASSVHWHAAAVSQALQGVSGNFGIDEELLNLLAGKKKR